MNIINKTVSIFLTVGLSVSMLSSCTKKDPYADLNHNINTPKYVLESDEWWDSTEFSVISDRQTFDFGSPDVVVNSNLKAITDSNIYVYFGGWDYSGGDIRSVNEISCYSIEPGSEGSLIGIVDLTGIIPAEEGFVNDVGGVFEEGGKTKMFVDIQYQDTRGLITYLCDIDVRNNSVGALSELKFADESKEHITINNVVYLNGAAFLRCSEGGKPCIYVLESGICRKIRLDNADFIDTFEKYDENNIIMRVTYFDSTKYLLLNTSSYTFTEIESYKGECKTVDHRLVITDGLGGDETTLLDFNNTYLSFYSYHHADILSVSDERVIIKSNSADTYETVIVLNKADTNPNAGKQIIEAAHLDFLTSLESEGISRFNRNSQDYLVIDNEKYNYWNIFDWDTANIDYSSEMIRAKTETVNLLMTDITAGEGPDIILGSSDFREIQNGRYLVNIEPEITALKLGSDQYFTNIIDAADIDGRKYVLPYDVYLCGLLVNKDDVKGYGDGIKIQDYGKFVDDVCNGKDPMYTYSDQMSYFIQLLGTSFDLYETGDGKISFDNKEFRALAEYVKENVPDQITYNEGAVKTATLGNLNNAYQMYGMPLANKTLVGMPSPDGRSAYCYFNSSASVTVCSSCQDGCWEFISSMLNDDVLKYSDGIPVSRAVFADLDVTYDKTPIDPSVVDNFELIVEKRSFYYSSDYTIIKIISEEMQVYFAGDKSLDDVIKIMNDRARTVLNERQ